MTTTITEKTILDLEQKLYKAIKENDISVLDELLHDQLLFVIPSGEVITKEMDLKTYRDGHLKIDALFPTVENLNIIDNLAVITLIMELKGSYHSQAFEAKYRYIRFWKADGNGIKVIGGSGRSI